MKVFQINTVYGTGSTGRIVESILKVLKDHGHSGMIAYGRGAKVTKEDVYFMGFKPEVYLHVLKTRLFDRTGFGSYFATKKLINKIKEYKPDIIQLHNLHGYYINIKVLFKFLKKYNKPVVWTLHDCWAITGHCAHFDYYGCQQWLLECCNCKHKKGYPYCKLISNSKRNFLHKRKIFTSLSDLTIITPSEWLCGIIKKSFLGKYPVKVINNGINLNKFNHQKSEFKKNNGFEDKHIVLGVSNGFGTKKGYEYFVKLAEMLGENYKIVMVGFKRQIDVPDNIWAISHTDSVEELVKIYNSASVFLNPTLEDTFPTVNIEAIACGVPVVTFDVGGSPEIINKCGRVVKKGNIQGLYDAIIDICENNIIDSNDCVERSKEFDQDDKFNDYIFLYEQTLKK